MQVFVNLPYKQRNTTPFTLTLEARDVPVAQLAEAEIHIHMGSFGDPHSPLKPPTQVTILDISLEEGAEVIVPIKGKLFNILFASPRRINSNFKKITIHAFNSFPNLYFKRIKS